MPVVGLAVLAGVTILVSASSPPGNRCSVISSRDGRLAPTVERTTWVVRNADVIVRARATRQDSMVFRAGDPHHPVVVLEITEVLAGDSVPPSISAYGWLTDTDDFNTGSVPYPSVRPSGMLGSCFAEAYRRGGEFLLLLERRDGRLTPYWAPLAPTNEQVTGPDDPWVRWVRAERTRHATDTGDRLPGPFIAAYMVHEDSAAGRRRFEHGDSTIFLDMTPVVSDADFASVQAWPSDDGVVLEARCRPSCHRLRQITSDNIGGYMATVVDSRIRGIAVIQGAIGGGAPILIGLQVPREEADRITREVRVRWAPAPP